MLPGHSADNGTQAMCFSLFVALKGLPLFAEVPLAVTVIEVDDVSGQAVTQFPHSVPSDAVPSGRGRGPSILAPP